jgi:hypothetical protein
MKRTTWWALVATLTAAVLLADRALSEDEEAPKPPTPEQMAKVRELAQPGPEHELFERLSGAWDVETRIWFQPGQPEPMVVQGTATSETILGGRFVVTRSKTPSPMGDFESFGIMGFDRRRGVYTTSGFDTMGTYGVHASGPMDAEKKAIVMEGTDEDPILGHTQRYKFVHHILGPDKFVVDVIFTDKAHTRGQVEEFKMVEVTYTRKRADKPTTGK